MDAHVVDIPFQDTNPGVRIVSEMPKVEQVMFYSGNNAYSVDLSAIDRGEGNINITLNDFRSHGNELSGYRAQHGESEYFAMLANLNSEKESEHTVGKILQYNAGSVKLYDSENPFIPQGYSKEESLNFMRTYAATLMNSASMTDARYSDESKAELGIDKSELQRQMEFGKAILKYESRLRDDVYTAEDVQSVFNTITEREMDRLRDKDREAQRDGLLAKRVMDDFNRCLDDYDQKLEVAHNFFSMTKNFQSHKGVDFAPLSYQDWEIGLPGNRVEDKPFVIEASKSGNKLQDWEVGLPDSSKRVEMPVEIVIEQKHGNSKDRGRV